MISEPVMTSPDRNLAARILERAQLAQMTRNLKLGLSQVSSNSIAMSNNNNSSSGSNTPTNSNKHNEESLNSKDFQTPSLYPLESKKRITAIPQDSKETSPLKKHLTVTMKKGNTNSNNNNNNNAINQLENIPKKDNFVKPKSPMKNRDPNGSSSMVKVPSTPKRSSSNSNSTIFASSSIHTTPVKRITRIPDELDTTDYNGNSHNNINISNTNSNSNTANHEVNEMINNSTGADLLIYLATSPYSKNDTISSSKIKIPTTPRTSTFGQLNTDDTIRLSHLKPSLTSPQSTLKNINYHSNNDIFNKHGINLSPNNMILESPSSYNNNSNNNNNNNNNFHNDNGNANITNNINNNLLKTPNFNMGDYIHSIFSPSPNVNLANVTKERNIINLKRNSIGNSLTQAALLSTSGISNDNLPADITNSINNQPRNNSVVPIRNHASDRFSEEHINSINKDDNSNGTINI